MTVETLARALRDAFAAHWWGDVDPYLLEEVLQPVEDSDHAEHAAALRATLQRAVDALNAPALAWKRLARLYRNRYKVAVGALRLSTEQKLAAEERARVAEDALGRLEKAARDVGQRHDCEPPCELCALVFGD